MSVELVKLIKSIAMDAVRASNPTEVIFGTVSKDYENDGQFAVRLSEKLELDETFCVFGSIRPANLQRGNRLVIIKMQGGQAYYVADVIAGGD